MNPFEYHRAGSVAEAIALAAPRPDSAYLAGGTELVAWLADGIVAPAAVIDLSRAGLDGISRGDSHLVIGGGARLADVAADPLVRSLAPLLAAAIGEAAAPAIRATGTLAGNLLQKTRCPYFRGGGPCNKLVPGSGCGARAGDSRLAGILAGSDDCVAVHPSDPAVALAALDATVAIDGAAGRREIPIESLYPELATAARDHELAPEEILVQIRIPIGAVAAAHRFRKVRHRAAFDFALVAAAVRYRERDGVIAEVAIALGGVSARPWRCRKAEAALLGRRMVAAEIGAAIAVELAAARPLGDNAFKVGLAAATVTAAFLERSGR